MRENRHFIRSTSISDKTAVLFDGAPAVLRYRATIETVEVLSGREAASLFAEPVLPQNATSLGAAVSWYCAYEGPVVSFDDIDDVARRPLVQKLSQRLAALAISDPEIGPILKAWLNISSAADILAIGGEPVLINWGFLPAAVAADPSIQASHFAQTIGRFAPALAFSATGAAAAHLPETAAARPPSPPPPPPPAAAIPTAAASVPGRDIPTAMTPGFAVGGPGGGYPPQPPRAVPIAESPRPSWLAPLLAALAAAIVLLILLIPGVLVYPSERGRGERDAFEEQRLRLSNESLEAQLKALQDTASKRVCRLNETPVPVPWLKDSGPDGTKNDRPQQTPKMELLPRAPERVALPPSPTPGQPAAANVGELLDNATVLILGLKNPEGASQGSGFFVSDRHVVTNHHVIQDIPDGNIFVASRAIGGIRRARLVAASQPPPSEEEIRTDIAVLEIQPVTGSSSLKVGITPPKLSTGYVAGFPGFITQRDVNFGNFISQLQAGLRTGNVDEALSRQRVSVPSADLKYGRINNVMSTGKNVVPIVIHDMQLAQGNSGGPLVDACGRLGGINSLLFTNDQGAQQANVAQDVSLIRKFLDDNHISFVSDETACNPEVAKAPDHPADGPPQRTDPPPPSPGK
jgi:S1-C subfamily serine protease